MSQNLPLAGIRVIEQNLEECISKLGFPSIDIFAMTGLNFQAERQDHQRADFAATQDWHNELVRELDVRW